MYAFPNFRFSHFLSGNGTSPNRVDQKWRQDETLANYIEKFFFSFPLRYHNSAPSNFIYFPTL